MASFVSTDSANSGRYSEHINKAINLDLCKSFYKSKYATYPDNNGAYSIFFDGIEEYWVFDNERTRDVEYEFLLDEYGR